MLTHDMKTARRGNRVLYLKDGVIIDELKLGKYRHNDQERHDKLRNFLTETGFFEHCKGLGLRKEDYLNAIDLATSIKPFRHVYLHCEEYRQKAKQIVEEDEILRDILK